MSPPGNESGELTPPVDEARRNLAAVADRLLAPVSVVAPDSTLLYVNAAASRAVGQEPSWLTGRRMLELIHPDDRERIERELAMVTSGAPSGGLTTYRLRTDPSREWRVFDSIADNLLDDARIGGILISSRDTTWQRAQESGLRSAAYRDALTGLPNRAELNVRVAELTAQPETCALAFVGIDRFRLINDSLGHTNGDLVLAAVAQRIRWATPATTTVARLDADVFALIIGGESAADARSLLWRIIERAAEPLFVAGNELRLSLSAGLSVTDATATVDSMLGDASLALNRAKSDGGGRVEVFAAEMRQRAVARLELEASLRKALDHGQFTLSLQPIVQLSDGSEIRSEALIRWHHDGKSTAPNDFIPVAEETGLIIPLGDWIIDRAAELVHAAPGGSVMVNLSARQLCSPGLVDRIARILRARKVPPSLMGFEVTETFLVEDFDFCVKVLAAIRALGCRVGLDDFGTGYSSLGYLRRLPIDFLKIDGSLSEDVDTNPQAAAIVLAITGMASALGLDVIAEGVETGSQAQTLLELGCQYAQGFLFGRPLEYP